MKLSELTYEQAKGRHFRHEAWGWKDGNNSSGTSKGSAYIKEDGYLYFSSPLTREYRYNHSQKEGWYEVDGQGYRIPESAIRIGGE